jgi:hypothetical protein
MHVSIQPDMLQIQQQAEIPRDPQWHCDCGRTCRQQIKRTKPEPSKRMFGAPERALLRRHRFFDRQKIHRYLAILKMYYIRYFKTGFPQYLDR